MSDVFGSKHKQKVKNDSIVTVHLDIENEKVTFWSAILAGEIEMLFIIFKGLKSKLHTTILLLILFCTKI